MDFYPGWWRDHLEPEFHPIYDDFKVFLALVWTFLGLPEPTPAQYRIAAYLQNYGELPPEMGRADIIMAFRGVGKSYITAAYVLWRLLRNPRTEKILVVSASSVKAKEFVAQTKGILMNMPLLSHLKPTEGQRNQADRFDVAGSNISQSPSLKAAGITGQITGSRATLIVADDIETQDNSGTEEAREKILAKINEFDAIAVPAEYDDDGNCTQTKGDVMFLGTPQSLESVYIRMIKERSFGCLCIPARVPRTDEMEHYDIRRDDGSFLNILDPYISDRVNSEEMSQWQPVDPKRFGEDDLISRESRGRSFFMLQYMLDTSLSDAARYPLKQGDFIVMSLNNDRAPVALQWGKDSDKKNLITDIPNVGFSGDHFLRPLFVDAEWRPYEHGICFVDPAGRGADETAWTIAKALLGTIYILQVRGFHGDTQEAVMEIARDCKKYGITSCMVEPNFAPGVWISAALPIFRKVAPGCSLKEADWSRTQKELRIIDTLEPALNSHRVVIEETLVRQDVVQTRREYSLLYQLTHLTRDRGALRHDDRLDSMAGAVNELQRRLASDPEEEWAAVREEELDRMLEDFLDGIHRPGRRLSRRRHEDPDDPDRFVVVS